MPPTNVIASAHAAGRKKPTQRQHNSAEDRRAAEETTRSRCVVPLAYILLLSVALVAGAGLILVVWMPDHPLVAYSLGGGLSFDGDDDDVPTANAATLTGAGQWVPVAEAFAAERQFPCIGLRVVQRQQSPFAPMVDVDQLRAAMSDAQQWQAFAKIPLELFNDDYCDCDDGSDEPFTSACVTATGSPTSMARSPSPESTPQRRFYCRADPSLGVPLWKVLDGVEDCCDGSDEGRQTLTPTDTVKCARVVSQREQAAADAMRRLANGHRQFQQRAVFGSTKFGPQFVANVTKESAAFEEAFADFQRKVELLNARIRRAQQRQQQPGGGGTPLEDGGVGDAAAEEAPVDPAEIAQAQQWNQYFTQRRGELGTKQAVLHHKALGQYFEYFPLFGKCFDFTVHEKQLKGGTSIPEQYYVSFRVCPFMYLLQRTETPEVTAAAARLAGGTGGDRDDGTTATAEDEAAEVRQKDSETARFIVAGYWTGQLVNAFDNITSLNVLEPLRRGEAPETAAGDVWVSQFTHGEGCWNGPARRAALVFVCDTEDRVRSVVENGMCRYEVLFGTPSACNDAVLAAAGGGSAARDNGR